MNVDRTAAIHFACGAPGSGKSFDLKQRLDRLKPDRLIAVDPDGEYEGWGYLHDRVADVQRAVNFATFRTRLRSSHDRAIAVRQFDHLCRLVRWQVDPQPGQAKPPRVAPIAFLVDELADFVGPSFRDTPESWQWIIRRGRKYGVHVLAASQRHAQIDKSLFDLCSSIRVGRLNTIDSQATAAAALGLPRGEIEQLQGIEYLERDRNSGKLTRGPAAAARRANR